MKYNPQDLFSWDKLTMLRTERAKFEQDPAWVKYFRFYAKDLREIKNAIQFSGKIHFECQQCGACCNFESCQHRCLLSWADVARWHAAGFDLGLFFVFPAHSIDGYSAFGIPTKKELNSGKFLQWIRSLDENTALASNWTRLMQQLHNRLGVEGSWQGENNKGGECIYLGKDRHCLIHPLRPGACHLFPYFQIKMFSIPGDGDEPLQEDLNLPCPQNAVTSKITLPEEVQTLARECAEAEAAAWAQERMSQQEVENLLVDIWRELLPKFSRPSPAPVTNF